MSEQDQVLARRVLDKKRLSAGQVEQLLEEAGRTGRSFRDLALGRGLLSAQDFLVEPSRQLSTSHVFLIFAGLMLFMGVALLLTNSTLKRSHAREVLSNARTALAASRGNPRVWNDALAGFDAYLEVFPYDADVLKERARVQQYRRDYRIAIADLEMEAQLNPARADAIKIQIARLRDLKGRGGQ